MQSLTLPRGTGEQRNAALYAAAVLHALARDEVAGRRTPRLTEPGLATWRRFQGRFDDADLLRLLVEDGAVIHQAPFDLAALGEEVSLELVDPQMVSGWLDELAQIDLVQPSADYVAAQARLLGVTTRLARSDLHVVKPHHKVLELPGTGGQLAHHLVTTSTDVRLQDNFVIACSTWQEQVLAGIVALDAGAPHAGFVRRVSVADLRDPDHAIRQMRFDFVLGLHPDKGGLFQVDDQLALWFSGARCILV